MRSPTGMRRQGVPSYHVCSRCFFGGHHRQHCQVEAEYLPGPEETTIAAYKASLAACTTPEQRRVVMRQRDGLMRDPPVRTAANEALHQQIAASVERARSWRPFQRESSPHSGSTD